MGGMRWGDFGGDQLSHLRALSRSDPDQWGRLLGYVQPRSLTARAYLQI